MLTAGSIDGHKNHWCRSRDFLVYSEKRIQLSQTTFLHILLYSN